MKTDNKKLVMDVLDGVTPIKSVYNGRPGCCCGCRGKHTSSQKAITLQKNKFIKFIEKEGIENIEVGQNNLFFEDGRYHIIYFL